MPAVSGVNPPAATGAHTVWLHGTECRNEPCVDTSWTLRGHFDGHTLPHTPYGVSMSTLPSGRQRREAPPLAVPVAIRFRLQSFPL